MSTGRKHRMKLRNSYALAATLSAVLLLQGCANSSLAGGNETELYQSSQTFLNKASFSLAIASLEQLELRFPFSRYAEQAQYDLLYAKFQNKNYDEVVVLSDRLIRLQPDHPEIGYAWYLKAMGRYELSRSNRSVFSGWDITTRDTTLARQAFDEFSAYVTLFPEHRYVPDARARQLDIRNRLAQFELRVAHYYLSHGAWVASANRATAVLADFGDTPYVDDALEILIQSYREMGQQQLADDAEALQLDLRVSQTPSS